MTESMKKPRRFQVPHVTRRTGWYEIPLWVIDGGAVPYPTHRFTLKDDTLVKPGQWIEEHPDGLRIALSDTEERG